MHYDIVLCLCGLVHLVCYKYIKATILYITGILKSIQKCSFFPEKRYKMYWNRKVEIYIRVAFIYYPT